MEEKNMQKLSFWKGFFCGLIVMLIIAGISALILSLMTGVTDLRGLFGKKGVAEQTLSEPQVEEKLNTLAEVIDTLYYKEVEASQIEEGVYDGLMNSLNDPYSQYYNEEEYTDLTATTTGSYYGIGAVLSQDVETMQVSVLRVYKGSPAEEAGLKNGDILSEVDGTAADSEALSQLVKRIKGEEGTTTHITILRDGDTLEFDVVRRAVEVPTVEYQMLDGEVGFIQITEFSEVTPEQFGLAVEDLQQQGMASMIIDIRDNPGGVLDAVNAILDKILPEGILVYTEDKEGNRTNYTSSGENFMELPIIVLINENSASASEIFAGAIQDYEYGTLIGTTTFGKGIVQHIIPLEDGSAVKVTASQYFTPKGNPVHEIGITPDIELEYEYLNPEDEVYQPMHDNQVQKALEVLQSQ